MTINLPLTHAALYWWRRQQQPQMKDWWWFLLGWIEHKKQQAIIEFELFPFKLIRSGSLSLSLSLSFSPPLLTGRREEKRYVGQKPAPPLSTWSTMVIIRVDKSFFHMNCFTLLKPSSVILPFQSVYKIKHTPENRFNITHFQDKHKTIKKLKCTSVNPAVGFLRCCAMTK
jgi:hypothetical protein